MGAARLYCLDASACALLSEDYSGTTRWHFQRELVACHSQACLGLGAAAGSLQQHEQQVVLIAGCGGRANVALHPTSEAAALQQALGEVQPDGECNLAAALKLALLVSRRFPGSRAHVTAFVASPGAAASLVAGKQPVEAAAGPAAELRQSFKGAGVSLDVAVLCPREELGAAAAAALEALTAGDGCSSSGGSSVGEPPAAFTTADSGTCSGMQRSSSGSRSSNSSNSSMRLVWLQPVASAAESWQQLEPALEQLEGGSSMGSGRLRPSVRSSASGPSLRSALPRRISRAPRQFDPLRHPRTPLLAQRSGLQQPALCRGESLSRLGHLSSDGMMRPWLPTYSSIGQQAAAAGGTGAAAAGQGMPPAGSSGEYCYVEVQPLPKWRTLLKVAAGRMLVVPTDSANGSAAGSSADSSPSGSGDFAAASSRLLRSLEALSVLEGPDSEPSSSSRGSGSSSSDAPAAASEAPVPASVAAPVRYRPDGRRGTLRLLQAIKEPHLLRLVWSAERDAAAAPAGGVAEGGSGSCRRGQGQGQGQPSKQALPFDMFGSAPLSGSSGSGTHSAGHSELLAFMPASAVAASAARGPIVLEGCELWEAAAEFDWELLLPAAAISGGRTLAAAAAVAAATGVAAGESSVRAGTAAAAARSPAAVEARRLPNGAQVVLVTPAGSRWARSSGSSATVSRSPLSRERLRPPAAAAFWLQQRLQPSSLQLPAYATAAAPDAAGASAISAAAQETAVTTVSSAQAAQQQASLEQQQQQQQQVPVEEQGEQQVTVEEEQEQQQQQQQVTVEEEQGEQGPAALLAAALLRALRQPPPVDLRRLRRDVKSGAIQVTPVTVGPLPAQFVRDILSARSALLSGLGADNLDTWEEEEGGSSAASSGASSRGRSDSGSAPGQSGSSGPGTGSGRAEQLGLGLGSGGAGSGNGNVPSSGLAGDHAPGEADLQRHKAAAWSLLRQRLHSKQPARGSGSSAGGGDAGHSIGSSAAAAAAAEEQVVQQRGLAPAVPTADAEEADAEAGVAAGGPPSCSAIIPCSSPQPTPQPPPPLAGSYSSSAAGTPFGTPLHILPSRLVHQRRHMGHAGEPAPDGGAEAGGLPAEEAPGVEPAGLAHPTDGCVKREGSSVLVGAAGQADGTADPDPLFQLE